MQRGGGALVESRPNVDRARELRRAMTLPEVLLWQALRLRPGGLRFRRQHPVGGYVADFACLSARLLIEVDGEIHAHGQIARVDRLRQIDLETHGYAVLRIAAGDILGKPDGVVRMIVAECLARAPLHHAPHGPPPRVGEDLL